MAFDLITGLLKIAGQPTGGRGEQPEQEKSNTVGAHAAEFHLPGYHHQIDRVKNRKKHTGGNTGGNKGRPEYRDNTLDEGYLIPFMLYCWICNGFQSLRPQRCLV